ncbi:MAG: hypothetical protein IKT72_00760 [Clostridia bacterium]|nr:hypothetical protein [Clostridia bacterium]
MEKKIDNLSKEELIQDLIQEKININSLNILKLTQREAFLEVLSVRPSLLSKVEGDKAGQMLNFAISQKPALFVHLKKEQYTDRLAQCFLYMRLVEREAQSNAKSSTENFFLVQKSLDSKIVFTYTHATQDGEELCYLDKDLQIPISIKSSIKITLKLVNSIALIEKLDTLITQLGEMKIKVTIADVVNRCFKAYLNEYIEKHGVGFYTLCASCREIERGFVESSREQLSAYGVEVSDFIVKQFAIPKDIQNKIENQSFEIRQRRADVKADAEFAKISLENYEAKLAIHAKYPDAETTLTEYEKDLALERYLKRVGREKQTVLDHTIAIQQKKTRADAEIVKQEDVVPEIDVPTNMFRLGYLLSAFAAAFVSLLALAINPAVGLVLLGLSVLVLGSVAAFFGEKLKTPTVEPNIYSKELEASATVQEASDEQSQGTASAGGEEGNG